MNRFSITCFKFFESMYYISYTDRRDHLQWAVNIKLMHVSVKNGQVRETVSCSNFSFNYYFISNSLNVEYSGGYHEYFGGIPFSTEHQGIPSLLWGIPFSSVEAKIFSTVDENHKHCWYEFLSSYD